MQLELRKYLYDIQQAVSKGPNCLCPGALISVRLRPC